MTEIAKFSEMNEMHPIDWRALVMALFLAPVVVTVLLFWAIIPVFALFVGAPTYLLCGTPAFVLAIRYQGGGVVAHTLAGFLANLLSYPVLVLLYGQSAEEFLVLGCIFAPLWALMFGTLYHAMARE